MIRLEDRRQLAQHIEEAHAAGARLRCACEVAGIDLRTLQRWKAGGGLVQGDGRPHAVHPTPAHAVGSRTGRACDSARGIRVNAVGPAFIRTPMIQALEQDQQTYKFLVDQHPIGRLGEPDEVAELVVWLSSDRASFVTGAYYPVDGGFLAH